MRASYIVFLALLLLVIGRWAHGKPALNIGTIAGGAFVIIVVALLDGGRTEAVARGIALILLAVAALNPDSPLTAIANAINSHAQAAAGGSGLTAAQQKTGRGGPNA